MPKVVKITLDQAGQLTDEQSRCLAAVLASNADEVKLRKSHSDEFGFQKQSYQAGIAEELVDVELSRSILRLQDTKGRERLLIISDRKLGSGSYGSVKLASHELTYDDASQTYQVTALAQPLAIKVIEKKYYPEQERATSSHEAVVSRLLHDSEFKDSVERKTESDSYKFYSVAPAFVAEGDMPLDRFLETYGDSLTQQERTMLMRSVIKAVTKMHEQDVIHRDLKPENLIVLADGSITPIDFGSSSHGDEISPLSAQTEAYRDYGDIEITDEHSTQAHIDWFAAGAICLEIVDPSNGIRARRGSEDGTAYDDYRRKFFAEKLALVETEYGKALAGSVAGLMGEKEARKAAAEHLLENTSPFEVFLNEAIRLCQDYIDGDHSQPKKDKFSEHKGSFERIKADLNEGTHNLAHLCGRVESVVQAMGKDSHLQSNQSFARLRKFLNWLTSKLPGKSKVHQQTGWFGADSYKCSVAIEQALTSEVGYRTPLDLARETKKPKLDDDPLSPDEEYSSRSRGPGKS